MEDIETDYKARVHAAREIPVSSCPSSVSEQIGSHVTPGIPNGDAEEWRVFRQVMDTLDEAIPKVKRKAAPRPKTLDRQERVAMERKIGGFHDLTRCRVDTEGIFHWDGRTWHLSAPQYGGQETGLGMYYAMDTVIVSENGIFYDQNMERLPEGAVKEIGTEI